MASLLRDMDRRTRTTTRRARPAPRKQEPPSTSPPPAPSAPSAIAAVIPTGEDGRVRWTYPRALAAPPVIGALAVDPDPADDGSTVLAALETVTVEGVDLRVWRTRPLCGSGVAQPAGAGLLVHITATPLTPVTLPPEPLVVGRAETSE